MTLPVWISHLFYLSFPPTSVTHSSSFSDTPTLDAIQFHSTWNLFSTKEIASFSLSQPSVTAYNKKNGNISLRVFAVKIIFWFRIEGNKLTLRIFQHTKPLLLSAFSNALQIKAF